MFWSPTSIPKRIVIIRGSEIGSYDHPKIEIVFNSGFSCEEPFCFLISNGDRLGCICKMVGTSEWQTRDLQDVLIWELSQGPGFIPLREPAGGQAMSQNQILFCHSENAHLILNSTIPIIILFDPDGMKKQGDRARSPDDFGQRALLENFCFSFFNIETRNLNGDLGLIHFGNDEATQSLLETLAFQKAETEFWIPVMILRKT